MDGPDPNAHNPHANPAPDLAPSPVPAQSPDLAPAPEAPVDPVPAKSADLAAARKRARARHDPFAHRRGEPRTFAILWMLYMVAAIMISLSPAGTSGLLSVEAYRPSARLLAALMAMGIAVVWPMVRLSQVRPKNPVRAVAQDQVIVMVPITAMCAAQAAPWMAGWPMDVGAAMALGLMGWSILVAGVLLHAFASEAKRDGSPVAPMNPREPDQGVARAPDVAIRVWAMLVLMALAIAGPLVSALGYEPRSAVRGWHGIRIDWGLMISPVGFALEVASDRVWTGRAAAVSREHWWGVGVILVVGLATVATARIRLRRVRATAVRPGG